ncbi:hypothetical protein ACFQVC_02215 [Streptomyces monticola]|uniref:Uncharacterized protein n=1 Tax=Streptomyces monticola TaxID=2666263 RepID=A0ABW2JBU9_9ACTN
MKKNGAKVQLPESQAPDPAKAKQQMVDFFGDVVTQLGSLEKDLKKSGPPPVDAAKADYARAMKELGGAKQALDDSRVSLQEQKVTDQASLNKALQQAGQDMAAYGKYDGPAAELAKNAALQNAFASVPNCSDLVKSASGPVPRS